MKRTIICVLLLMTVLLTGCASNTDVPDNTPTTVPSETQLPEISVDYDLNEELAAVEAEADKLFENVENMTQFEMNDAAYQGYQLWDKELNSLWERYVSYLDEDEKAAAIEEENEWVSDKEAAAEAAGAEYEGGSMMAMVIHDKAMSLTRERSYIVAGYLGEIIGQNVNSPF